MATGQEIINGALVELKSEASRPLETGTTLGAELQIALNTICVDDIPVRWPFSFLIGDPPDYIMTVPNQSVYTLEAPMQEIFKVVLDTFDLETRPLTKLPLRRFLIKWANLEYSPQDKPIEWCQINEDKIRVAARPDSIYRLNITGTKIPPRITDFNLQVTAVPTRFHMPIVVYGVAAIGASKIGDETLTQKFIQLYERGVKQMIEDDKRDPDVEYQLQPFRAAGRPFGDAYWNSPFVRSISQE